MRSALASCLASFVLSVSVLPFSTYAAPGVSSLQGSPYATKLVYEFSKGNWLQNLAVRSNGNILITSLFKNSLHQIDPLSNLPEALTVYDFLNATSLLGITEGAPDIFYVAALNNTFSGEKIIPYSNQIFRVTFIDGVFEAQIDHLTTLTDASLVSGLTTLNSNTILAADTIKGVIWAIDTNTGSPRVFLSDPSLKGTGSGDSKSMGVQDLKIQDNGSGQQKTLYFTNKAQGLLAKVAINQDGKPAGKVVSIMRAPTGQLYGGLTLNQANDVFVVSGNGNTVLKVSGGVQTVIAGSLNSTEIAEPTAIAFGREMADINTLYVITTGGIAYPVSGTEVVGGQLVAIDLGKKA